MATNSSQPTTSIDAAITNWQQAFRDKLQTLEIQLLIAHVLGQSRTWVLAHGDYVFHADEYDSVNRLVKQAAAGTPLPYLTGEKEFWSLPFRVTPATLIPRPETELLVDIVLDNYLEPTATLLDLGTGSGAIAVAIASEKPEFQIVASDRSMDALKVAKSNAERLLRQKLHFIHGSWLDMIGPDSVDIIVSNPPYIAAGDEHLNALKAEPEMALVAASDGLADIANIVAAAFSRLTSQGMLLIEHGYDQQQAIVELMKNAGYRTVEPFSDLAAIPRAVLAKK